LFFKVFKRKLEVAIVRIKMVDRYHAKVEDAPNITITFASEENGEIINQILGMLMHDAYQPEQQEGTP
jgi:hypothetical protein